MAEQVVAKVPVQYLDSIAAYVKMSLMSNLEQAWYTGDPALALMYEHGVVTKRLGDYDRVYCDPRPILEKLSEDDLTMFRKAHAVLAGAEHRNFNGYTHDDLAYCASDAREMLAAAVQSTAMEFNRPVDSNSLMELLALTRGLYAAANMAHRITSSVGASRHTLSASAKHIIQQLAYEVTPRLIPFDSAVLLPVRIEVHFSIVRESQVKQAGEMSLPDRRISAAIPALMRQLKALQEERPVEAEEQVGVAVDNLDGDDDTF